MYHRVSMMFGDLIKVTPSSKVVGDMALFMVQNDLTEEDVYAKGDILDFPASVVEFFEGRIGTPYQGFPEKLQKLESGDVLIVSGNIPSAIPQDTYSRLLETVKDILAKTIKHDGEVFGASEIECGNYKTLNLDCAKKACREYLEAIRDINDIITYDDVNQRGC